MKSSFLLPHALATHICCRCSSEQGGNFEETQETGVAAQLSSVKCKFPFPPNSFSPLFLCFSYFYLQRLWLCRKITPKLTNNCGRHTAVFWLGEDRIFHTYTTPQRGQNKSGLINRWPGARFFPNQGFSTRRHMVCDFLQIWKAFWSDSTWFCQNNSVRETGVLKSGGGSIICKNDFILRTWKLFSFLRVKIASRMHFSKYFISTYVVPHVEEANFIWEQ